MHVQFVRPIGLWLLALSAPAWCGAEVPHFPGLGHYGRQISTNSEDAQQYLNQGLAFLHAFNHDEAIRSFAAAAEADPTCAMAWWGIALANGPHINNPAMPAERSRAAWQAICQVKMLSEGATGVEQALIAALGERYAETPPEDRQPLDKAYAEAMRKVWQDYPRDADVGAFFAESLMDLRPWDLWSAEGEPRPETEEVVATVEAVLRLEPHHPLALHLYIHAVEASPEPGRAEAAANRLRLLTPGLGHLVHMPSHIDVRLGHWDLAVTSNRRAIEADRNYRPLSPSQDFYRLYMAHNHHMLAFAAIMRGQSQLAIEAIDEMIASMPTDWVEANALFADGFLAMPVELLVRFGRWQEVLSAPEPPAYLPLSRTLRHAARGIAWAALGELENAREEQRLFLAAKEHIAAEATVGNNSAVDVVAIAEQLLAGELLYREGQVETAITALNEAIAKEDQLHYDEPPAWIHPVRHALGATLLAEHRAAEAEAVYRADLEKHPDNGWALFGLAESLRQQGKQKEAADVELRFRAIWIDADVTINSSCYCQPGLSSSPRPTRAR